MGRPNQVDVVILAAPTHSACIMLRNTATACAAAGLKVEILVPEIGIWYAGVAELYSDLPVRVRPLRLRGPISPGLGYPRPIAWLTLLPRFIKLLDHINPRCVITHIDCQDAWRVIHWWAKSRRVPGIVVQEGIGAELKCSSDVLVKNQISFLSFKARMQMKLLKAIIPSLFGHFPEYMFASHVCAWGSSMKRQLVAQGRMEADISVTGSPLFDSFRERKPLPKSELATVLFAHQTMPDSEAEYSLCKAIIDICVNRIGCRFIFRPHPHTSYWRSGARTLVAEVADSKDMVMVADSGPITDYLDQASVFLTLHSSSAYEAIIHGVPLVLIDWVDPHYHLNAAEYNAAIQVDSPSMLEQALREALWKNDIRENLYQGGQKLLEDHLYQLDGRAAERVADTARRLIVQASTNPLSV